jgi:hypothetical protein
MVWRVRLLPSMVEVIRVTYMVIPHQFYSYIDFYYRAVFNIFEIRTAYFIEITKSKLRLYVNYINSKYFTYMSTACIVNIKTTWSPGSDKEGSSWMYHHVLD